MMIAPKPPPWLKELVWLFNAWFSILLPAVGAIVLWRGKGLTTGLECIGWGLVNLLYAYWTWADRPIFRR